MATGGDDLAGVIVKVTGASGQQAGSFGNCTRCLKSVGSNCYCRDCGKFVCGSCRPYHDEFTTGHVFTDGPATGGDEQPATDPDDTDKPPTDGSKQATTDAEEKDSSSSRPRGRCETHRGNEEKLYCETCTAPLCADCFVKDHLGRSHIGHQLVPIEQQVDNVMSELGRKRQELNDRIDEEQAHAAKLRKQMKIFEDKATEEERKIEGARRELVARQKLVEATYSDAVQQNQRAARDFSDRVKKQLDDVENKIKELRVGLKRVDKLESDKTKFTQSHVVNTVIPTVSGAGRDVIPPPQLLTHSHVRHVKHVGCQVTATCNNHGTLRFRRPVDEIEPDTHYYSDESTVGHVQWSLAVFRWSDGELGVALVSDRLETLSDDYEADVEFSGRILHPTQPEKHVSRGKRNNTFTRASGYDGWYGSDPFCEWEDLKRGGHIADGFLTVEVDVHVKKIHITMKFDS